MKKTPILRVTVEREPDTGAYFASWESPDGNGISGYSTTPIGAIANALHTMILIAEDRVRDKAEIA